MPAVRLAGWLSVWLAGWLAGWPLLQPAPLPLLPWPPATAAIIATATALLLTLLPPLLLLTLLPPLVLLLLPLPPLLKQVALARTGPETNSIGLGENPIC